jgi:anti-sigma factor RsiW
MGRRKNNTGGADAQDAALAAARELIPPAERAALDATLAAEQARHAQIARAQETVHRRLQRATSRGSSSSSDEEEDTPPRKKKKHRSAPASVCGRGCLRYRCAQAVDLAECCMRGCCWITLAFVVVCVTAGVMWTVWQVLNKATGRYTCVYYLTTHTHTRSPVCILTTSCQANRIVASSARVRSS